jgi:hypothetical protein
MTRARQGSMASVANAFQSIVPGNNGNNGGNGGNDDSGWAAPAKPKRDIKKFFLVLGLGVLSWVATYVGMLELIEANMGELPLIHKLITGFSVAMLMTMIVWLLDQMFAPIGLFTKTLYAAGYLFLSIISIGFGFGFYWKVLESRSEASRSAEGAVAQVQGSLYAASTRLEQLSSTLESLKAISLQKADMERANGTSCLNSKPGEGPRRKMREDDASRFSFASDFVKTRVAQVKADMSALDVDLAKIVKDDKSTIDAKSGNRNEFMKQLGRKLDMTVTGFNAFRTDPQLKQIKADLAERADKTTFPDSKGGTFACPDQQLQGAVKGAVRAITELPELDKPKIAAVEGSEATIEAFRRLTATFGGLLTFKMPLSSDELRALQQKAVQSVEGGAVATARASAMEQAGLSKRDYVPLAVAMFVDICLLLVSMGRPMNRLNNLVPKMQAAESGPVFQILSKFTDIHKDPETREKFEVFRHVVFDFHGDYYVAVPLNAPYRQGKKGQALPQQISTKDLQDLQLEAHLLANLFSSFEQEKIFKRVHNPMLRTKVIQEKLWQQGSKFAGSSAFRVYRFHEGAWSEIILGAVMGAAKRTDGERRRRRELEASQALTAALDTAARQSQQPQPAPVQPSQPMMRPHLASASAAAFAPVPRHPSTYAANAYQPQGTFLNTGTPNLGRSATGQGSGQPYAQPQHQQNRPLQPAADLAAAFGPYAAFQHTMQQSPQSPQDADATVRAANSNTMPSAAAPQGYRRPNAAGQPPQQAGPLADVFVLPARADNVVPMPNMRPQQAMSPGLARTDVLMPSAPLAQPVPPQPAPPPVAAQPVAAPAVPLATIAAPAPVVVTAPAARPAAQQRPSGIPAGVDVEMIERTMRFTVPSSEAILPANLFKAGVAASLAAAVAPAATVTGNRDDQLALDFAPATNTVAIATSALKPGFDGSKRADDAKVIDVTAETVSEDDYGVIEFGTDTANDDVVATARRFARTPAE